MATRAILTPESAQFPASNFPQLLRVNGRPVLAFDASTDETCYWTLLAPQGLTGALSLICHYIMASATTGAVVLQAAVEAITPGDAVDLDTTTSFDADNSGTGSVPGTAGYEQAITITLTNADSVAAGDYVRVRLFRDADAGGDTAAGDFYLLAAELRDAA